mmetsp:Transcript_19026/g.26784  ORF Transcript_19026/g.26784 Transcript_19026/m.26784 type:complete len:82 (-) Transcript_19026:438-683(-)
MSHSSKHKCSKEQNTSNRPSLSTLRISNMNLNRTLQMLEIVNTIDRGNHRGKIQRYLIDLDPCVKQNRILRGGLTIRDQHT